ncbi:MAG: hypothetical protein ABH884_03245 [Candidatus Komeilibacteria bacterium]
MSFGDTVQNEQQEKGGLRITYGSDYVKLTNEHMTVIRVLDETPKVVWKHYIPRGHFTNANNGKGMSIICDRPGCVICEMNKGLDDDRKKMKASKRWIFNVLDRTPVIVCPNCGAEYYETKGGYPQTCTNRIDGGDCRTTLPEEPSPRNKIQILERGRTLVDQLVEYEDEFGSLDTYDIKLSTKGTGTDTRTTCLPQPQSDLNLDEIVGEGWKLYDTEEIIKPLPQEVVQAILDGKSYYDAMKEAGAAN